MCSSDLSAKDVAGNFIKGRFQDRIGIVIFSGDAYSLSPLTTDYELLEAYLKDIDFDMIESRSEERRVGKECRSRWSPYH